jgi:hypothetical protein
MSTSHTSGINFSLLIISGCVGRGSGNMRMKWGDVKAWGGVVH